jgi:hypothetical protein
MSLAALQALPVAFDGIERHLVRGEPAHSPVTPVEGRHVPFRHEGLERITCAGIALL